MTNHLYYRDSTLLVFVGQVVGVTSRDGRPAVELDQTAFYPTSGGQPHDLGTLGGVPVVDVVEQDGTIFHLLAGPAPEVGATVEGRIEPTRRADHTQQHTGQHVLSQAFEQTGGLHTVSFHLGSEACTIDLDRAPVSAEEVRQAEHRANQIVLEDRPILVAFVERDELARLGLRKPGPRGAPRTGEVRIVEIDGFDRSACGGTHVRSTGQIGPIKVRRWERRGETTRVEFVCGWRALTDYTARLTTTRNIAERLSVADAEVGPTVLRALDDLARLRDEVTRLREEQLDRESAELLARAVPLPGTAALGLVCAGFAGRSADELKRLALRIVAGGRVVALLGSSGERGNLVFAQTPGLPFELNALLREVAPLVGARGGGTRDLAQGGSPNNTPVDPSLAAAQQRLLQK
jgi:alanyl-tRNA synthetase